jgi:hypothetical protein
MKVGFSRFCEIRPRNVFTAGACATHSICVCSSHKNIKLMLSNLNELPAASSTEVTSYKDCLSRIISYVILHYQNVTSDTVNTVLVNKTKSRCLQIRLN